jgi:hypothetical protein
MYLIAFPYTIPNTRMPFLYILFSAVVEIFKEIRKDIHRSFVEW